MKNKFLILAATASILAACSNNDVPQADNLKDTPITVTAGVAELNSRAGYEDTSVLPETFYLSITQDTEDATSMYNYTNVLMTKGTNNVYTSTDNLLWKGSNRDVAINAYTTDAESFTVQADQSTDANVLASDLLGAVSTTQGDVSITDNNISINFRHLLCKLDVTYTWGTEFDNVTTKTIKSVMYQGFGTDVTLDREACTVTSGTTTAYIKAYVNELTSEAIFAPQMGDTPKIVITTTIDDVERIFSIGVTAPTDGFASGNRYTMNVTIGGTSVTDGLVTATLANGWGESITGNMTTN
ncbi:MAG: fimbrillin family protein [Bacteroidaceae bacterium]|nr:fimbrillin family protein [Bacteroidaceae bacterium]